MVENERCILRLKWEFFQVLSAVISDIILFFNITSPNFVWTGRRDTYFHVCRSNIKYHFLFNSSWQTWKYIYENVLYQPINSSDKDCNDLSKIDCESIFIHKQDIDKTRHLYILKSEKLTYILQLMIKEKPSIPHL